MRDTRLDKLAELVAEVARRKRVVELLADCEGVNIDTLYPQALADHANSRDALRLYLSGLNSGAPTYSPLSDLSQKPITADERNARKWHRNGQG